MPEIREIDEFKNDFIQLGNEPEIRSQRGEPLPDIEVPESSGSEDLDALFEDTENEEDLLESMFDTTDDDLGGLEEPSGFDEIDAFETPDSGDLAEPGEAVSDETSAEAESLVQEEAEEDVSSDFDEDFSFPEGLTEGLSEELEEIEPEDILPDLSEEETGKLEAEDLSGEPEVGEGDQAAFDEIDLDFPDDTEFELPDVGVEDDFSGIELESEAGPDDFDTDFSFDDETIPGLETEAAEGEESAIPGMEFSDDADLSDIDSTDDFSLEDFSLDDISEDDIEATEFSLGDLGQEFGVDGEEEAGVGELEDLSFSPDGLDEELSDAYDDENYVIPDDEWISLKKTLGQMPRNLKILIEELIGEKHLSGENLDKLLKALIKGASAKEIAAIVSKITGKKVKIPLQYERRTAAEFEKEKSTFSYAFRKNFVPMFRTAAIAAALLGLILFIGFRFIYRPVHAESLYKKGYEEIYAGNNQQANSYFDRAFGEWRKKNWFYKYAEGFSEQRQYLLAEEKYSQLLSVYPDDRDGILDYADLEFSVLGKYPEAEKLLKDFLFDNPSDYDARLMLGDTYMEWAREIDSSLYEKARFNYAKLLELYGGLDPVLFRMMRYFIRTDNYEESMKLYEAFRNNPKVKIEPDIYAELAGYLIDNDHMGDVREILMKARFVQEELPEIHYELARYFKKINIPAEEEKALLAAVWLFENTSPLTRTRKGLLIDSYNRYGKVLYKKGLYIDSEEYYQKAAISYEEALEAGQLSPDPEYGTIYSNLGDLAYYISGEYDQALTFYNTAERNGYSPFELKYKKGYIYYNGKDYRKALVEFYDTAGGFSVDKQLLYSTANTLFNRNDYYLAEGYYTHLLDILNKEYSSIDYLLLDEIPEHRMLVENIMKVSNNLGVTKYRLYQRDRDPEKNAEAMLLLTDSTEYYDKLARDSESLVEPETVNLSYLNSKAVFYPVPDYNPQIYQDIPKDMLRPGF